jgi:WD40 repeat protein
VLWEGVPLRAVGSIEELSGDGDFSPDGRYYAEAVEGTVRLWDLQQREEVVTMDLGKGKLRQVVFSPDGRRLRYVANKRAEELDLQALTADVEGNLAWNLEQTLLMLVNDASSGDRLPEAERIIERLRATHPEAYRRGQEVLTELRKTASAPSKRGP